MKGHTTYLNYCQTVGVGDMSFLHYMCFILLLTIDQIRICLYLA